MMSVKAKWSRWLVTAVALGCAAPVCAQTSTPSESAMANLVRLLVEQGVITKDKGAALLQQAETEAAQARAAKPQQSAELPPPAQGTIRVPYVPETVRAQIKEELKAEVLQQARAESWASPGEGAPEWTKRITLHGDVRVRSQSELYSKANSNLIPDFARINGNGPTDVFNDPIPFLNSRIDKEGQLRLRARLGATAQIGSAVEAGIMLATGDDNGPISTNAALAGGFGKRDIWLQEAYIKARPTGWSAVSLGRFENPFTSTDLLFDSDLSFDGLAAEVNFGKLLGDDFDMSIRGGAFPLDFGDRNYPSTDTVKRDFPEKYLFSAQIEAGAKLGGVDVRLAGAYHSFTNVQGQLSDTCLLYAGAAECSTDGLQPFFLRKGNTLSPLRRIAADPGLAPGAIQPQPQFFGLTFDYDILNVNASVTFPVANDISIRLVGDYVRNLSFKRSDICRNGLLGQPFNNGGSDGDGSICSPNDPTSFVGGNQGYQALAIIGHPNPRKIGQWSAEFGYRYIESDAVLDSLTDSDFHLGGTNAKGYFVGGKYGVFDGVTLGARWMSANEISGEPLAIDVLQIDLQASF